MSTLKWIVVALLLGSGPASAQGTAQSIMPAQRGGSGSAEPIGRSGSPVPTGSYNYWRGRHSGPATGSQIIIAPQRRNR